MKVTDEIQVRVRLRKGHKVLPVELTYVPRYLNDVDAVQVRHRGFKQAALLNPKKVEQFGSHEMILRFLEYFFGEFMGYGPCEVLVMEGAK